MMRWTTSRARDWYQSRAWLCGFNYVVSTAVNSTEMWQGESFDLETINRELDWAKNIELNSCRVFLQYLVWRDDPTGLMERIDQFLQAADKHKISAIFIFFDDCAFSGKEPYLGKQDGPVPGVHNSGWTPSPGHQRVVDQLVKPQLEDFVTGIVSYFARDDRILAWDIYNEPGNVGMGAKSLPLLRQAFQWVRNGNPEQPLTTAVWSKNLPSVTETTVALSDVITFHNYGDLPTVQRQVSDLKSYGRPVICTEWMARHHSSLFQTHLPFFKREEIGCYCWGLVNGKTQTHLPWESRKGATGPDLWFHDLFDANCKPYREKEIEIIREYTRSSKR